MYLNLKVLTKLSRGPSKYLFLQFTCRLCELFRKGRTSDVRFLPYFELKQNSKWNIFSIFLFDRTTETLAITLHRRVALWLETILGTYQHRTPTSIDHTLDYTQVEDEQERIGGSMQYILCMLRSSSCKLLN